MSNIWVISDTHFCHGNILSFKNEDGTMVRDFRSVDEMNEKMIDNWNKTVRDGDKIYHLGDVYFDDEFWVKQHWGRLRGRKRLVVGNHDDVKRIAHLGMFKEIMMWRKFSEFGLLLTHVPVHPTTLGEGRFDGKDYVNVHGHIHSNASPPGPYKCVCVEHTNYTPVNIEELRVR